MLPMGDYKHWTQDRELGTQGRENPRTRDPRTKDQGPEDIAVLHLALMTQMQLVSMF